MAIHPPSRRQFLAFGLVMAVLILGVAAWRMTARSPAVSAPAAPPSAASALAPPPLEKAIIGTWVNAHGGSITFYANGTGFVPGVQGVIPVIPDSSFSYSFPNPSHLAVNIQGQLLTVGIKIEGDKMTWSNGLNDTVNEYTRTSGLYSGLAECKDPTALLGCT